MSIPDRCGKCGYELTGLPARSVCPECGNRYSKETRMGLRAPDADSQKLAMVLRRVRTIALAALAGLVALGSGVLQIWVLKQSGVFWIGAIIAVLLAMAAVTSYLYENN